MPENPRRLHFGTDPDDPDRVLIYAEGGYPAARGYLELDYVATETGQEIGVVFVSDWVRGDADDLVRARDHADAQSPETG